MTAQIEDRLRYKGEDFGLYPSPLEKHFSMGGYRPNFDDGDTGMWRGYVAAWDIVDNNLYLVGLRGQLVDGSSASMASVFPESPERIPARWFTGTLRLPQGELLEEDDMSNRSIFERELLLDLVLGVVVYIRVVHNGSNPRSWLF